jgi:hypothetical protein
MGSAPLRRNAGNAFLYNDLYMNEALPGTSAWQIGDQHAFCTTGTQPL